MNYFIADLHLGHKNVIYYDNRPFNTTEENDNTIITNWNNAVSEFDDVYILGDISWYNATKTTEIFKQLNGIKHWIVGNHDNKLLRNRELKALFVEITHYKEIDLGDKKKLVLCHYPIHSFNSSYEGGYHFYGHVHNTAQWHLTESHKKATEELFNIHINMHNVGCMLPWINYTPRTFEHIISNADIQKNQFFIPNTNEENLTNADTIYNPR